MSRGDKVNKFDLFYIRERLLAPFMFLMSIIAGVYLHLLIQNACYNYWLDLRCPVADVVSLLLVVCGVVGLGILSSGEE